MQEVNRRDHHVAVAQGVIGAFDSGARAHVPLDTGLDRLARGGGQTGQRDPVLRALGPGQAGLHRAQIELHKIGEEPARARPCRAIILAPGP